MRRWFILLTLTTTIHSYMRAETSVTFCNPIDLSYRFQVEEPSRREAADPTVVWFKDRYYLFASMSGGYWHSLNLVDWQFIATDQIPTEEYAPCAFVYGDTIYFLASSNEKSSVYQSKDPLSGEWSVARETLETPVWDPAFFLDEDGRLYLFWGCSNVNPIYGVEVDIDNHFDFIGKPTQLIYANPRQYGWEVPGDYNTLIDQSPWIEGPWLNKHDGTYYLQFAGPGTEYKSYADGAYTADKPLGPYTYQPHNPFSYKPEGFAAGAGHGSTFIDVHGNYWHIGTITISQKHVFERRLGLYPTFIDPNGTLYSSTRYGDYPMKMPSKRINTPDELYTGWMLLSYKKPVKASSSVEGYEETNLNDEDIRTYWAAASGEAGEYAELDLGETCDVFAVQLNFAEHDTRLLGRVEGLVHQYVVAYSMDGETWETLADQSQNRTDNTHVYLELPTQTRCRYLRVTNCRVPDGHFAMSGFRVFGTGNGSKPGSVSYFEAKRNPDDRRCVTLSWAKSEGATGYVIRFGIDTEQLYHSYQVYEDTSITIHSLDAELQYFYTIEAFNENGISHGSAVIADDY